MALLSAKSSQYRLQLIDAFLLDTPGLVAGVQLCYLIGVVLAVFPITESKLLGTAVGLEAFVCFLIAPIQKLETQGLILKERLVHASS